MYATSNDGKRWDKPALGLVEFEGSRENNIVMRRATHGIHAGGILKDPHDSDPARRYKFVHRNPRAQRMASCFSADGLRWSQPLLWPEHDAVGDTHNNVIWLPESQRYICITRGWSDGAFRGVRTVLRSQSEDFLHWSEPAEIMRGADAHDQIYSMPIARYGHLFIGLPTIFHKGDPTAADWDTVDTELAISTDSVNWQRIFPGEPLIPRGAGSYPDGEYDCGCIYAAAPLVNGDNILLYYGGSNGLHNGWREGSLNLAILDIDRFAGYAPRTRRQKALLKTAPLHLTGAPITLNAEVAIGGWIRARLLDSGGLPLDGFGFEDCIAITEGGLARDLRWQGERVDNLQDQAFRLVIEICDATVFAITGVDRVKA